MTKITLYSPIRSNSQANVSGSACTKTGVFVYREAGPEMNIPSNRQRHV